METALSRIPICMLVAILAWWLAPDDKAGVFWFGVGSIGVLLILSLVSLRNSLKKRGEHLNKQLNEQ